MKKLLIIIGVIFISSVAYGVDYKYSYGYIDIDKNDKSVTKYHKYIIYPSELKQILTDKIGSKHCDCKEVEIRIELNDNSFYPLGKVSLGDIDHVRITCKEEVPVEIKLKDCCN